MPPETPQQLASNQCRTSVSNVYITLMIWLTLPRKLMVSFISWTIKNYWSVHLSKGRWLFKYLSHKCIYTLFFCYPKSISNLHKRMEGNRRADFWNFKLKKCMSCLKAKGQTLSLNFCCSTSFRVIIFMCSKFL